MVGKGRLGILAVRSSDPVLSVVAPLGLAASVGTCLVIDLAGDVRPHKGRSLPELISDGPSLQELSPGRPGVAVIGGGGVSAVESVQFIEGLGSRWPAVVVRVGDLGWPGPTVPVRVLYPGWLAPEDPGAAVWQPVASGSSPSGPGPVLPRLSRRLAGLLLAGRLPSRSRWVAAWSQVWGLPWA